MNLPDRQRRGALYFSLSRVLIKLLRVMLYALGLYAYQENSSSDSTLESLSYWVCNCVCQVHWISFIYIQVSSFYLVFFGSLL